MSAASAVCSSQSAILTHPGILNSCKSQRFDRDILFPRLAAAGRGVLAILDERLGLLLLDKVGQLVSIGEGFPKSCSLSCSLATSDGPRLSYSVASFALDNS